MASLTDIHEVLSKKDEELTKIAREEDAAGRIMARGFAAEILKLAGEANEELAATESA